VETKVAKKPPSTKKERKRELASKVLKVQRKNKNEKRTRKYLGMHCVTYRAAWGRQASIFVKDRTTKKKNRRGLVGTQIPKLLSPCPWRDKKDRTPSKNLVSQTNKKGGNAGEREDL